MRLLSKSDIWSVYSMSQAIEDVAQAFVATSAQQPLLPLRTRLNLDADRTVLVMPAAADQVHSVREQGTEQPATPAVKGREATMAVAAKATGDSDQSGASALEKSAVAVKTIALYPKNANRNLPTAPATILLLDGKTGMTKAVLDGDTVTKIRTGASSGVAFRYFALAETEIAVVVGTGGQAYTQALATITTLPNLKELRIVNPQLDLAESFVAEFRQWEPVKQSGYQGKIVALTDADQAAVGAQAIVLVTSSHTPVISAKNLMPGTVISCVGSYQPHMQECGADVMASGTIICDQCEAALEESGDLIIPIEKGIISVDDVQTEIGQIISGQKPGRQNPEQIFIYETVGVGSQDLWTANAIYELAQAKNIGQQWEQLS